MKLIAYLIPGLSLLLRGKKLAALICLILQLTIIGWIPAAFYAVGNLSKSRRNKSTGKSKQSKPKKMKVDKPKFVCQHCGLEKDKLAYLIDPMYPCSRSPTKKHIPYDKGVQPVYYCKHCGLEKKKIGYLTDPMYPCSKSPTGKHQVL